MPDADRNARRGRRRRRRGLEWALASAAGLALLLLVLVFAVAPATDRSAFCRTCHEMRPYNASWTAGPHRTAECVECHVAPGRLNRLAHKWVALDEVRVHLFGDPRFPGRLTPVPNDRCLRCHESVKVQAAQTSRFSHDRHAKAAECWECHTDTGHRVPLTALSAEGVLADNARPTPASVVASETTVTPRPGHVKVSCTRCHDQASMACGICHKPPHADRGACEGCHRTGKAFAFVHPTSGDCAGCHKPKHPDRGKCADCHRVEKAWTFHHPSARDCARCHKAPANHFGPACASCHSPATPFAKAVFRHPSTGSPHSPSGNCASCHPSGPPAVSCTCHGGGRPTDD